MADLDNGSDNVSQDDLERARRAQLPLRLAPATLDLARMRPLPVSANPSDQQQQQGPLPAPFQSVRLNIPSLDSSRMPSLPVGTPAPVTMRPTMEVNRVPSIPVSGPIASNPNALRAAELPTMAPPPSGSDQTPRLTPATLDLDRMQPLPVRASVIPSLSRTPPVPGTGPAITPPAPGPSGSSLRVPGPAEQRLTQLLSQGPPVIAPLTGWRRGLEIAGAIFAPRAVEGIEAIRHAPLTSYDRRLSDAEKAYDAEIGIPQKQAQLAHEQAGTEADRGRQSQEQAETNLANARINQLKEKPEDKFLYHDEDANGNAVAVFQGQNGPYTKPLGYQAGAKPRNVTSPFEAFAYGTPDEKQAAQQFLDMERSLNQKYDKPTDVEARYSLFKRDPEAYRAMYGNRGQTSDQAQAARMLKYFDGQRKAIQNNFTLSDEEKQQQLGEIDELEKPYRDAAQVSGGGNGRSGGSGAGDTVQVISPTGVLGTVPRAKLQKALQRGYRQAGVQ